MYIIYILEMFIQSVTVGSSEEKNLRRPSGYYSPDAEQKQHQCATEHLM